jgi:hypothetical protein
MNKMQKSEGGCWTGMAVIMVAIAVFLICMVINKIDGRLSAIEKKLEITPAP